MYIPSIGNGIEKLKQQFDHSQRLPFQQVLPEERIDASVRATKKPFRKRVYTPAVTVWAFLSQMLSKDKSCKDAVSRIVADRAAKGEPIPSTDASAYNQARQRFPEQALHHLTHQTGQDLEARVPADGLWKGRYVEIIDGSTVLMADTPENQAAYPQHGNQKEGCGFPIARIVATFSLLTGALKKICVEAWKTHVVRSAREIYPTLVSGTVVLGDAIFGSYADLWLLSHHSLDGLFQIQGARKTDFRTGARLGIEDHLATWIKPKQRPKGLPQTIYDQLPQTSPLPFFPTLLRRQ